MKKYFHMLILLMAIESGLAQTKPKQNTTEKTPTQKEMQELMKEAQMEMDNLSEEDKKAMEEMGIKMPSFNDVPDVTDAQLKEAYDNEMRLVPLLDTKRIATIPKTPLSDGDIPAYLEKVHKQLSDKLGTSLSAGGEQVYQSLKSKYKTSNAVANAGVGCWMLGKPQLALYLLSKASKDNPADANNLNNFAALLSMSGAEQVAIPLLDNLNKRFPQNSTILNNLGQAWFGLGEITKAGQYLDITIRLCAYHPQANVTKSLIEESKGEKEKAVESMKRSIKEAYSGDKVDRLRSLGYKVKADDITWNFKPNPEPLGLGSFKHPAFPSSVEQSVLLQAEWNEFRAACDVEIAKFEAQLQVAEPLMMQVHANVINENTSIISNAAATGNSSAQLTLVPLYAAKALLKMEEMYEDAGPLYRLEKALKRLVNYTIDQIPLEDAYEKEITKLKIEDNEQTGEGLPNKDFCPKYKEAADRFLRAYNPTLQQLTDEHLALSRAVINEQLYWTQFTVPPEHFEVAQINAKMGWLKALKDLSYKSITAYNCEPKDEKPKTTKLGSFNDMHCMYNSTLDLMAGTINSSCGKTEAILDLAILKDALGIEIGKATLTTQQGDKDNETFMDQFQSASLEVGLKKSVGVSKGPLKAEAKLGGSGFVEVGKNGVTDAGVKVVAEIEVGTDVIENGIGPVQDQSMTIIGAESELSIGGGFTAEATGILKGM